MKNRKIHTVFAMSAVCLMIIIGLPGCTKDEGNGGYIQDGVQADYSLLPLSERLELLCYCGFDYFGAASGMLEEDITVPYLVNFYTWYLNENYNLSLTASDISNAFSVLQEQSREVYDGVGETQFAGERLYDGLCRYYGLYPSQEIRTNIWGGVPEQYGDNPIRSKFDTDEIEYYVYIPGENKKFSLMSLGERREILGFDGFNYNGAGEGVYGERITVKYLHDFYSWYINDRYGLTLTPEDINNAFIYLKQQSYEASKSDGAGNTQFADELLYNGLCRYYKLYPTQEIRQNSWFYESILKEYGDNPRQSKYDTDEIKYTE